MTSIVSRDCPLCRSRVGRGGMDALVQRGEKRDEKILDEHMGLSLNFVGDVGL